MTDIDEIVDTFELLGDWDQRYEYLLELGERMEPMPAEEKTEENRVKPCMSTVHVHPFKDPDQPERIRYRGDCDTAIIKGVLALLVDLFSGRTAREIQEMDVDGLFSRLRLAEHLSPNRHVGIYAIVDKMKEQAAQAAGGRVSHVA
ncbi:MAG: SufE family protein [Chromatiales bacterium]|jgi:cysteine desulfuration protein SufE